MMSNKTIIQIGLILNAVVLAYLGDHQMKQNIDDTVGIILIAGALAIASYFIVEAIHYIMKPKATQNNTS